MRGPMYSNRVQRSKLGNQVLRILQEMIANHRFQPGTRINVEELSRELGVSRTPLWEAVHRLEQEGLLVRVQNRGVFIAELTLEQALDLYAVRMILEASAARLAAVRIGPEGLARMEEQLRNQETILATRDLIAYSRSDFEFHAVVYEACGNPYLRELLERTKAKMRPVNLHIEKILEGLYRDHQQLLEALRAHDPDRAEQVFRAHNEHVMRVITEEMSVAHKLDAG